MNPNTFPANSRVYLNITSALVSSNNSLFVAQEYSALLFSVSIDSTTSEVQSAKLMAEGTLGVALATVLGGSFVMGNPSSLFFFLQTLEMYYYVLIYTVSISPSLNAFLSILNGSPLFPNWFTYIVPESYGVPLTGSLYDYGYDTNLFMQNSTNSLFIIILLALGLPFCYLLRKISWGWLSTKMTKYIKLYKFCVVSRLLVQMFLEFLLNTCIGLYYTQFANFVQIIDACLCILTLVIIT